MALPPILVEAAELGNWAKTESGADGSSRYWPIMHHEPSAATLTRGKGVGEGHHAYGIQLMPLAAYR